MKKYIYIMVILIVLVIPKSTSYLSDNEKVEAKFASANCFDECGEKQEEEGPQLVFYSNKDNTEVGFVISGIEDYDKIQYEIIYEHDPGIQEAVITELDNSSGQDILIEEWVVLGFCSQGVCTYHSGVEEVDLQVNLKKDGNIVNTLNDSLSF